MKRTAAGGGGMGEGWGIWGVFGPPFRGSKALWVPLRVCSLKRSKSEHFAAPSRVQVLRRKNMR